MKLSGSVISLSETQGFYGVNIYHQWNFIASSGITQSMTFFIYLLSFFLFKIPILCIIFFEVHTTPTNNIWARLVRLLLQIMAGFLQFTPNPLLPSSHSAPEKQCKCQVKLQSCCHHLFPSVCSQHWQSLGCSPQDIHNYGDWGRGRKTMVLCQLCQNLNLIHFKIEAGDCGIALFAIICVRKIK